MLYDVDDECEFKNESGVRAGYVGDDKRHCRIVRRETPDEWPRGMPEYIVRFVDGNSLPFPALECDLKPVR